MVTDNKIISIPHASDDELINSFVRLHDYCRGLELTVHALVDHLIKHSLISPGDLSADIKKTIDNSPATAGPDFQKRALATLHARLKQSAVKPIL